MRLFLVRALCAVESMDFFWDYCFVLFAKVYFF
jgi:hypothetical protein